MNFAYLEGIIYKVHLQEIGYTSATTGRGYNEVHKGYVVEWVGVGELQDEL
jgi:hypothetical protein